MKLNLKRYMFSECEHQLLEYGNIKVTAFKYSTGVEALRIENEKGYYIILPFQGQQVWRARFCGHDLVMKSTFDEPVETDIYLRTYGGFLLHCGINAMGVPSKDDDHLQHGEIPNAIYNNAYIECDTDEGGNYITVGGSYEFNRSFVKRYVFSPSCKLYENGSMFRVTVELENKRHTPMEYMYLCHINFRPVDGAKLIYSAPCDKEHFKVYPSGAEGLEEPRRTKMLEYVEKLRNDPTEHLYVGKEGQMYDPELCFGIDYVGDEDNRAHTMQYTDDGAYYVSHPVDYLPKAIRWIARTPHEDSMGMVLPATSEHFGYNYAKENGQIKVLEGNEKISFYLDVGYLEKEKADEIKAKIEKISG